MIEKAYRIAVKTSKNVMEKFKSYQTLYYLKTSHVSIVFRWNYGWIPSGMLRYHTEREIFKNIKALDELFEYIAFLTFLMTIAVIIKVSSWC